MYTGSSTGQSLPGTLPTVGPDAAESWGEVMKGLVRPCRHRLGQELHTRWRAHLCGLCLTLRDEAGQAARVLTGYDALLLSVLVEAQSGTLPTSTAGRCPLRGLRSAEVVRADLPAMQLATAASLLTGAAGLQDKRADRDLPLGSRSLAAAASRRYERQGVAVARRVRFDPATVLGATAAAHAAETSDVPSLDDVLAPTGAVVSALFAHTAAIAGRPDNRAALARVGDAFGRLVHLIDAVDDLEADARRGRFNPLAATGTGRGEAHRRARALTREIAEGLDDVVLAEPALARLLLGPELERAVSRTFPGPSVIAASLAVSGVASAALFGRRRRRREVSCWESLACDCCCNPGCDSCDACGACDCCSC
ncbi:hypothetical protein acdb102_18290 [Acidothermaceae bacterium B102]|nr:hypothetical protein acdb102_18290 [Acidothermaceae bacterium B102]